MNNEFVMIKDKDCNGYMVDKMGNVMSYGNNKHNKILKPMVSKKGYMSVECNNKQQLIHRLVALTFIPNPQNLPQIDHIDNNPANNKKENLRWINNMDNSNRRYCIINAKNYTKVQNGFRVMYVSHGIKYTKRFKEEDDAIFYVKLLKAIYPH